MRLDKWLWAARFFKTRSLATQAITSGKVHMDSARIKPSKELLAGSELRIRKGEEEWTIIVDALAQRRGPASEALTLYSETEDSIRLREAKKLERKVLFADQPQTEGRPSKKDRRQIHRFKNRNQE